MRGFLVGVFAAVALDAAADTTEVACFLEAFDCGLTAENEVEMPAGEAGQDHSNDAGDDS